jgi:hypothetical protein
LSLLLLLLCCFIAAAVAVADAVRLLVHETAAVVAVAAVGCTPCFTKLSPTNSVLLLLIFCLPPFYELPRMRSQI